MLCGQEDFEVVVEMGKYNKKTDILVTLQCCYKSNILIWFRVISLFLNVCCWGKTPKQLWGKAPIFLFLDIFLYLLNKLKFLFMQHLIV